MIIKYDTDKRTIDFGTKEVEVTEKYRVLQFLQLGLVEWLIEFRKNGGGEIAKKIKLND